MAWIELHQTLPRHPKLARLAARLKITRPQAAGHLTFLWLWAIDYVPDGNLSAMESAEVAAAAEWPKETDAFLQALKDSGWIDNDGTIHDWSDYGGKLSAVREADRLRKNGGKAKDIRRNSAGIPPEHSGKSDGGSPESTGIPPVQYSTVHNSTVPAAAQLQQPDISRDGTGGVEVPDEAEVGAFADQYPGCPASGVPGPLPRPYWLKWYAWRTSAKAGPWPKNWRADLRRRFEADWLSGARETGAAGRPDARTLPARIRALEAELENHPGNPESGVGSLARKQEEHPAYLAKRKELEQLQSQLHTAPK